MNTQTLETQKTSAIEEMVSQFALLILKRNIQFHHLDHTTILVQLFGNYEINENVYESPCIYSI